MARSTRTHALDKGGVYHCWCKLHVAHKALRPAERSLFREIVFATGEFCAAEIINYAILPRHLVLLIRIAPRRKVGDEELVKRARQAMDEAKANGFEEALKKDGPRTKAGRLLRKKATDRMFDLTFFMKTLNQRVALLFHQGRASHGQMWTGRYKSLPVEDSPSVIAEAAASVDARVIWEKVKRHPDKYAFCGFGEAAAGPGTMRKQIIAFSGKKTWPAAKKEYALLVKNQEPRTRSWNMARSHGSLPTGKMAARALTDWKKRNPNAQQRQRRTLQENIDALRAFHEDNGHFRVTRRYKKDPALARWVASLRLRHAVNGINEDTLAALDAIGFDWTRPPHGRFPGESKVDAPNREKIDAQWLSRFNKLKAFYEKHGHTTYTRNYSDKTLANWVWLQRAAFRQGKMRTERKDMLDSLHFDWNPRKSRKK